MFKVLKKWSDENPLSSILIVSAIFRIAAAIFSKGYGMHDDHFLVIEPAQSWVDGADYNDWLPSANNPNAHPSGHSLFYPGIHFLLFSFLQFLGMHSPQSKMLVVRLLHAAWSMIIVYLGYKIALRKGGIRAAKMSGWLLAILFFMPMMSVRNLVEVTCIPPLLLATWIVIKNENKFSVRHLLITGFLLSIAFSVRFQTLLFVGGFMLVFLIQKKWKEFFIIGFGFLCGLAIIQSATDMIVWHKPFVEFIEYVRYNIENAETYNTQKWYNYLLLISGVLIPPISLFLIFGFIRSWKNQLILFLPTFIFFVFHSSFPNKQERFIFPAVPFIIILGSIGWIAFMLQSSFWSEHKKLYKACWIFFIFINTIPLLFITVAYSHRSRVESMVYLSTKPDLNNVLIEESCHDYFTMPPRFYIGQWKAEYYVTSIYTIDSLRNKVKNSPPEQIPNYVVFNLPDNIGQRVVNLKKLYPNMEFETIIEPGFIDMVMTKLNKHNANFTSYVFRLGKMKYD